MEEPAKQALVPSQEVAWSRVLRELGVDPKAAKAALAVEHYEEAAGVEKPMEPEPEEARPEKRFALGLSAWAESVTSQLKDKDGSTFEAVVAKAFEDAAAGEKRAPAVLPSADVLVGSRCVANHKGQSDAASPRGLLHREEDAHPEAVANGARDEEPGPRLPVKVRPQHRVRTAEVAARVLQPQR